jgi:hypothetical protein
MKLKLIFCFLIIILTVSFSMSLFAGTKGKIVGTVIEKGSKNPLPGANVSLEGTTLGAMTDKDGHYFILNVPIGTYSLKVTYMGFNPVIVNNVKVIQDMVTEINVDLEPVVLEVGETIEIVAERPLIHKEVSASVQTISSEQFENRILESIQSVINTSTGVASYQGETYIRGSRWTEVNYTVDGLSLTNPITGGIITDINKNAVEEIVLLTGGYSAEYGNAMGGIVNVVTKEGGPKLEASLRYKTDKLSSGTQFYRNANIWDVTLGGPVWKDIRFFLTGYLNLRDMNPQREVIAPDGTNLGRHPHEGFQEYRTNFKVSFPIMPSMKLKLTGSLNRSQQLLYNRFWRFGSDENQLDRLGALWEKSRYGALVLDHVISPKTFYTFKAGYLDWHSKNGQRDRSEWSGLSEGANCDWWKDFKFREPFIDHNYQIPGDENTYSKWRLRDSQGVDDVYFLRSVDSVSVHNPYGITAGIQNSIDADYFENFIWFGDRDWYEENRDRYFTAKFDLTSQLHKNHEIKAGFELIRHKVNRLRIGAMSAVNGVGITYPIIDFYEQSPSDTALTIQDVENLGDGYMPLELATYLNYQLQLKGIFVNLGVRFDYFNAVTEYRKEPLQQDQSNPFRQDRTNPDPKYQFSPRLGVSFPVTDRILFRFNYGHFFQRPPLERLFAYLWFDRNQADVNMGNPNIDPQKTVAYEAGISTILREDLALDITAYQKNMYNLEGYRISRSTTLDWFFQAFNEEYAESKGVEITLRKRYSHYFGGSLSYTLSFARGTSSDVTQIHRYPLTSITYAKQLGYDPLYPQDTMPMNFDQRHAIYLNLDFQIPLGEGPSLFRVKPLSGFGFNIVSTFHSGTPYTPVKAYTVDITTDRFNSMRYPWTLTTDGRFYKKFRVSGYEFTLFAEVSNLLNFQKPFRVYEGSGNPDQDKYNLTAGSLAPDTYIKGVSGLYSEWADANGDGVLTVEERLAAYQRFQQDMLAFKRNYPSPRTFLMGFEIRF